METMVEGVIFLNLMNHLYIVIKYNIHFVTKESESKPTIVLINIKIRPIEKVQWSQYSLLALEKV